VSYRNGQRLPLEGGGALRLSVNPRARRLSIRIDARAGEAVAVAPSERRLGEVVAFARTKAGWIAERLAARLDAQPFEPGAVVTWLGRPLRLEATGGAGAARLIETDEGPVLRSGGEGEAFSRRIENWFRRAARDFLTERTKSRLRWAISPAAMMARTTTRSAATTRSRSPRAFKRPGRRRRMAFRSILLRPSSQ